MKFIAWGQKWGIFHLLMQGILEALAQDCGEVLQLKLVSVYVIAWKGPWSLATSGAKTACGNSMFIFFRLAVVAISNCAPWSEGARLDIFHFTKNGFLYSDFWQSSSLHAQNRRRRSGQISKTNRNVTPQTGRGRTTTC